MSPSSRYTILRKIADGGMAEIFLATQHGAQGFEKPVVLKRILTTFYADPQFRHMLVDEAHVAMTLNHSNIVQVLDLGEAEGRYFLVLELVDGWTLDRVLRRSKAAGVPPPPALALYVTAEVCRALAYAHGKKRSDGSRSASCTATSARTTCCCQRAGRGEADRLRHRQGADAQADRAPASDQGQGRVHVARAGVGRADRRAFGSVLRRHDALRDDHARHPFEAPTDYETLMRVQRGDFVPPEAARPSLNPELYRVIRKAMAKTPGDRYQTAEEMLVDVEQVMRQAFRPVGQTELKRWLADLTSKDGVPPLTREAPPEPVPTTVGPLRASDGQESGLVLNLDDAVEIRSKDRPPPPPAAATEVMTHAPQFVGQDRRWIDRREVRIGRRHPDRRAAGAVRASDAGRRQTRAGTGTPAVVATPEARPNPPPPPPPRASARAAAAPAAPAAPAPSAARRARADAAAAAAPPAPEAAGRTGEGRRRATRRGTGGDKPADDKPAAEEQPARREAANPSRARRGGRSSRSSSRPIRMARASRRANAFWARRR